MGVDAAVRNALSPTMRAATAALVLLLACAAPAREIVGVDVPETLDVAGKTLQLNGAAVRTRFFFKVYVIGLYLEHPATSAEVVLNGRDVRHVALHMLRSLDAAEIASAIGDAFERNSPDRMPGLRERLDRFEKMFPAVRPGDVVAITVASGKTAIAANGRALGTIDGDDFGSALLAVWLGPKPVEDGIKQALLAGR
jgi:hypothetical protein